ncbi:MAG: polyprenyl diphosphate synthase [Candidatus Gracilibacteria bacterium]|nr:polyprenyl diphosphate synthase [Candidatus Gracilibacteria bacterium]
MLRSNFYKKMHLALIIDGNRRWAKKRFMPRAFGHKRGVENLEKIIKITAKRGDIDYLSVFTLSTENMQREEAELENLFTLIEEFARKKNEFIERNIKVKPIGDLEKLPLSCLMALRELEEATSNCTGMIFAPAINYGGQDDLRRAFGKLMLENKLNPSMQDIKNAMDTHFMPQIDLLIRTGGKKRVSNFMMWDLAYSEIYFSDKMWPSFDEGNLNNAMEFFAEQKRTFGK